MVLFRNHRPLDTKYTLAGQPDLKMTMPKSLNFDVS
jgi:hypothetical protein